MTIKFYLVGVKHDVEIGGTAPDTAATGWTARYLTDHLCLLRDPKGSQNYPPLTADTPTGTVPLEVRPTMTPDEINAIYDRWGIPRQPLWSMLDDRVGGE
jgi:hypothetical protein